MKKGSWYLCVLKERLLSFDAAERAYIRESIFKKGPLACGRVFILFSPSKGKVIRFSESLGVNVTVRLFPSNVNPVPLTEDRNSLVEESYREYVKEHPMPKRVRNSKFLREQVLSSLSPQ